MLLEHPQPTYPEMGTRLGHKDPYGSNVGKILNQLESFGLIKKSPSKQSRNIRVLKIPVPAHFIDAPKFSAMTTDTRCPNCGTALKMSLRASTIDPEMIGDGGHPSD